jgi:uncharacterized damage-inducible protein DinB
VADPTVEAAKDILADSLDELRKALAGCSAGTLNRLPLTQGSNSLAVLASHALGSTRSWLSLATDAPLPERDRDAEFKVVVDEPTTFMATFDASAAACRALLDDVRAFEPARTGTPPWRTYASNEPVTAAWALLHALEHLREHVGHAQLTRQLLGH